MCVRSSMSTSPAASPGCPTTTSAPGNLSSVANSGRSSNTTIRNPRIFPICDIFSPICPAPLASRVSAGLWTSKKTRVSPPHTMPRALSPSSRSSYSTVREIPRCKASSASAVTCASIFPPPTVPRLRPSPVTNIFAPAFLGVDPEDSTTVATTKALPFSDSSAILLLSWVEVTRPALLSWVWINLATAWQLPFFDLPSLIAEDGLQYLFRFHRHPVQSYSQRVIDSIGDGRRSGYKPRFSDSLSSIRTVGVRIFNNHGFHRQRIHGRKYLVVPEIGIQEAAFLVDHLFSKSVADPHQSSTIYLPFE